MNPYKVPFRVNIRRTLNSFCIQRDGDKEWLDLGPYWFWKPLLGPIRLRATKKFLLTAEALATKNPPFSIRAEKAWSREQRENEHQTIDRKR